MTTVAYRRFCALNGLDRVIDERNRFVSPNTILALLSVYLKRERKIPGGLARSVATTHLIDAIAKKLDVPLYETPVGFKYIGELILADKIAMGGEESAGMSMYRHLPEKDGILACLLVAEMVARTGKRLHELTEEVHREFGFYYSKRTDMKLTAQLKETLANKLATPPTEIWCELATRNQSNRREGSRSSPRSKRASRRRGGRCRSKGRRRTAAARVRCRPC